MKISKIENNVMQIAGEISRKRAGVPVLLADLRERLQKMSKSDFDLAVLAMAKNGYFLSKHFHPAQATEAEKKTFVPDGEGGFYIAINPREPATSTTRQVEPSPKRPGRGGSRAGAGRPMKKTKVKRVPLQGARIPGWLMEWLKAEGNMGSKIEAALIAQYGLTPPG